MLDVLAYLQQKIIELINAKFAALRRLAELLEKLADLSAFLPDISKLIPLSLIDLSMYENLRASCPFLNLPPATGPEEAIGRLRSQVYMAYAMIMRALNLSQYLRLGMLQAKLDEFQSKFNLAALGGGDFIRCLQAICATATAIEGTVSKVSKLSPTKIANAAKTYVKNMVDDGGQVLSDAAKEKVSTFNATRDGMIQLMDVPSVDIPNVTSYNSTKPASAPSFSTTTPVAAKDFPKTSSDALYPNSLYPVTF